MITTSIIAVVTLASAMALAGLAGLWVDNVDRRWQQHGFSQPTSSSVITRSIRHWLGEVSLWIVYS